MERHLEEFAAEVYRTFIYPFKRFAMERKTNSILQPGSYVRNAILCGRNFLGKNTAFRDGVLGFGSYINRYGDFTHARIGKYSCIGANVSTAVGSHPLNGSAALHPAFTNPEKILGFSYTDKLEFEDSTPHIEIGNDVWIGNHVVLLDGIRIGDGAVVGAGAVVTWDLPPYSVNVGVPAKTIRYRFPEETIDKLLRLKWWNRDEDWIRRNIARFRNADELVAFMEEGLKVPAK
ncbi:MAG: hypothetical protein K5989_07665 [Lachnospiraceae bacterium]|nr:hypothetical protein [Lachnospiraceae bacterium]